MGNLVLVAFPSIVDINVVDGGKVVEVVPTVIELALAAGFKVDCESESCDMLENGADGRLLG